MASDWHQKTTAQILSESEFSQTKQGEQFHVLGVMGFAGSWKHAPYKGEQLRRWVGAMKDALRQELLAAKEVHQDKLVVASGATLFGVLQLVYEICEEENIVAMGITSERALRYKLGKMEYLISHGHRFGDESDIFVRTCDEFLLLGGGKQSEGETMQAHARGKIVTIMQGFGGVADLFTHEQLPNARFVRVHHSME